MPQTNNEYKGERLSFFEIFSKKKYKLVVPIIQRDYAQGRVNDTVKEVRADFLNALYDYLDENKPSRDLDFVYGTLLQDDDENRPLFIPLDGQQRLTTLFLLHWFLYQISEDEELKEKFKNTLLEGENSLFTYETRQSSEDFCNALMRSHIDMNNLLPVKIKVGKREIETFSLSETIKDQPWFFRIWKNDPTVQSMLVMLDSIHERFIDRPEFFDSLLDEENPIITFIFMDLKKYKLTDDLYIKMNSRGKPLTRFENFKAKFEQYLKGLLNNDPELRNQIFTLRTSSGDIEVDLHRYFSHSIDTKWTTLFWQYCKHGNESKLDTYIENFIRVIITGHYASHVKLTANATTDDTFDVLMSTDAELKSLSFGKYESTKALNKYAVLEVIKAMDALYNGNQKVKHLMDENYRFYYDEEAIFTKVLDNNLTRNERVQFYAYIQFLIHNNGKPEGINEWMRVIHNLSHPDNSFIDGNDDLSRCIVTVKDILLPHSSDIISYIRGIKDFGDYRSLRGFTSFQREEEKVKALLIKRPEWKEVIERTEKHNYFNGQIGFILEFAGIVNFFETNERGVFWTEEENNRYLSTFNRYAKLASFIFMLDEDKERLNNENFSFERAVLSHGNYLLKASSNRRNLLSTETVQKNVKRDLSWKRLLRLNETREDLLEGKRLVKATFDDIDNDDDIINALERQCQGKEYAEKWREVLISNPRLIEACEYGFMAFHEDQILLLIYWFTNAYHYELFTYNLWLQKFEDNEESFPGFEISYEWQKTIEEVPYILLYDYKYQRKAYHIYIETILAGRDFKKFKVSFGFENARRFDYPEEIMELMEELKFEPSEEENDNSYVWYSKSENSVYQKVKELTNELYQLKQ